MNAAIEIRRFDTPDDTLDMKERGGIDIIKMADGTSGMRAVFEPGWTRERACPGRIRAFFFAGS